MDLTYLYTLKRSAMGRQPMFCEFGPEMCDNLYPSATDAKEYILRNPVHAATQHAPRYSEREINSMRAEYVHTGARHVEGGWPRDININDPEATQRYRRKLEKEDAYIQFINNTSSHMEHFVFQNNAIDLYQTYYTEIKQFPKLEQCDCRVVNVFHNAPPRSPARPVGSICWQPEGGHKFVVSYPELDVNRHTSASLDAFIWDTERPDGPDGVLTPPSAALDVQYSPRDAHVLAGALANGQVCAWDARVSRDPAALCSVHVAHRDIVRNVLFISSKSGMEFFSGSSDGSVKWWDMRNMNEPTEELILDVVKTSNEQPSMSTANGVSVLEYEHTIPSRFMVGTENGLVLSANRKGKTHLDKLPGRYEAHVGPVWRVQRNPGFLKNFLTVGDWTARIWSEDCHESSILWTAPDRRRLTDAAWSPTRYSVLLLTKCDGLLAVWDLLRCQHAPALTMQVCAEPLLRVRVHEAGAVVACGSAAGHIYLLELSRNLLTSEQHDKANLTSVLEREYKRERILEARQREIRLKHRQADEMPPALSALELDPAASDKDILAAAADYFAIVKKESAAL